MKGFKTGQKVKATKMESDSFYKQVIGTVQTVKNGFVEIKATEVMDKWSNKFKKHPTSCVTATRIENVQAI